MTATANGNRNQQRQFTAKDAEDAKDCFDSDRD